MIIVNKAILHVFDTTNRQAVLSDTSLTLDNNDLLSFLEEHIGKCFHKATSKPGVFLQTSEFYKSVQNYLENEKNEGTNNRHYYQNKMLYLVLSLLHLR